MKNATVIFKKQISDTFKNKTILVQFLMFPVLVVIMENAVKIDDMPEHFFAKLFAVMFVGMSPLTCMAEIISEEKEKNTLRVLLMSNVRPLEYLAGAGAYVFVLCMAGAAVFAVVGGYRGMDLVYFLMAMSAGIILSGLTGAIIGVFSTNQMMSTSLTVPVMMVFSFLPMLSMFNNTIRTVASVTYSQQISNLINAIGSSGPSTNALLVITVNFAAALILFIATYKRRGLD
ncbi:MAG: ABC transporter permease [Lachnospiraceae bacterium]|nr:ABC transporter permease [Lachnospiraceae bacterium]